MPKLNHLICAAIRLHHPPVPPPHGNERTVVNRLSSQGYRVLVWCGVTVVARRPKIDLMTTLQRHQLNVKRGFSEWKRADAKGWARGQLARTRNRKYRPSEKQMPDPTVAKQTSASPRASTR